MPRKIMRQAVLAALILGGLAPLQANLDQRSHLLRLADLDLFERQAVMDRELDVWEHDMKSALVYLNDEELAWVRAEGFRYTDEQAMLRAQLSPKAVDGYFTLEEYEAAMTGWAADYSGHVSLTSLGKSIENRDIWMLKVSNNPTVDEDKPEVFLISLQHCREWLSGMALNAIAGHLIENYGTDPLVTDLVDDLEIYIVLVANPDGYVYTHTTDRFWRKNRRDNGNGTFGVDLNRNFPVAWEFSTNTGSNVYGGPAPLSEPETLAVTNFLEDPARRLVGLLNYHTFGTRVMHSYAFSYDRPPNWDVMGDAAFDMAQAIESVNGQRMRNGRWSVALDYIGAGATVDYAQMQLGIPAFTLELRPGDGQSGGFAPTGAAIAPTQSENIAGALQYLQWARGLGQDVTPPVISEPVVSRLSSTEATITWRTDEMAIRSLEFGTNDLLGTLVEPDQMPSLAQEVRLTGLSPNTTYHYRASARNLAGLTTDSDLLQFTTTATAQDIVPPSAPAILWLVRQDAASVRMAWLNNAGAEAAGYRLYESTDRVNYTLKLDESVLTVGSSPFTFEAPPSDELVYYKLVTIDAAGNESAPADIYPFRSGTEPTQVLLVDSYDRWNSRPVASSIGNHDFLCDFGFAVSEYGLAFDVTTDNSAGNVVDLNNYRAIMWMLGDENSNTFTAGERTAIESFLAGGGRLFVSGSEVAYNLDRPSGPSAADRAFIADSFGVRYAADDADEYDTQGTGPDSLFGDMFIPFDEGSQRIYRVTTPDVLTPTNGATVALRTLGGQIIGTQREGTFGGGTETGKVVFLGFPYETIFPESKRVEVMAAVLRYFDMRNVTVAEEWMIY